MRLRVSRLAQWDIDQIHDHIAADKPAAARRWVERTRKQFKFLSKNPHVGEAREEILPALRSFSHGAYVIFYRTIQGDLEIVRVVHGRRDLDLVFS
jgi:toxin ParE1/3/4